MTPAAVKAMYARQMAAHGENMTLTRGATTETVRGRVFIRGASQGFDQITDTLQQVKPIAVILADDLSTLAPPLKGDVLTAGGAGYMVDDVDGVTRRIAGVVVAYELTLMGA